jgi:TonB-linked SusC/RagA family outer membrane protein
MMKITLAILFACSFQMQAASVYGQTVKLSIDTKEVALEQIFRTIEKKSEFLFNYLDSDVNGVKARVNVKNGTIEEILTQALRNTNLDYSVNDRHITIFRAAQQPAKKTVSGTVVDNRGESIPGANILEKGLANGTVTDLDGKFTLEVMPGATLVVSYIGFVSQEIVVGDRNVITVTLSEDTQALEEVIVVGYGIQKKVNLTGSVGTIKANVLEGQSVTNIQEILQGKSPGLNVTKSSGQPGSGASMDIRGTSTIGGSSGILVIIDGVPGNINTLNPNDVESISILKDAASASIYGSRAANGVILVTTKGGTDRKELQVTVNTSVGSQNPLHFIDFVGAEDFMNLYNLARTNEGNEALYKQQDFDDFRSGRLRETVWYREMFERNQLINNNHISFAGKTQVLKYNISAAYDYQSGSVKQNNYNRYIFKPDLTFIPTKWLSVRANVQYTETHLKEPQGGAESYLTAATRNEPTKQIYNSQGQFLGGGGSPGGNPIGSLAQGGTNNDRYKEMLSVFLADITPLADWHIRPMFSLRTTDRRQHNYTRPVTFRVNALKME